MELKEVQNSKRKEVVMTVRTTKENYKWIKEKKINSSLLFEKAIQELKEKAGETKK